MCGVKDLASHQFAHIYLYNNSSNLSLIQQAAALPLLCQYVMVRLNLYAVVPL
jgi:hypothetical protein